MILSKCMKNKILFVINEFSFFKSHRYNLILELSKFYKIEIITDLKKNLSDSIEISSNYDIRFINLNKRESSLNPLKFLIFLVKLRRKINISDSDFIFFVSLENCLIGSLISKSINPKKIFLLVTGIGNFIESREIKRKFIRKFHALCYRYLLSKNHLFIFQNKDDQSDLTNYFALTQSKIIEGNGVDSKKFMYKERFNQINKREIKFLFASSLQYEKGVIEYVKAAMEIAEKGYKCIFSIAGRYAQEDSLSITNQEYNFISNHPKLNYLGEIDHFKMPKILFDHDIFVLPSYREGLPSAAIEAAATGMPLILSDVPGCNSLIVSPMNGFLVKSRNSQSLSKAMIKILSNKWDLKNLGMNSRKMVEEKFLIEVISEKYLDLLH